MSSWLFRHYTDTKYTFRIYTFLSLLAIGIRVIFISSVADIFYVDKDIENKVS